MCPVHFLFDGEGSSTRRCSELHVGETENRPFSRIAYIVGIVDVTASVAAGVHSHAHEELEIRHCLGCAGDIEAELEPLVTESAEGSEAVRRRQGGGELVIRETTLGVAGVADAILLSR